MQSYIPRPYGVNQIRKDVTTCHIRDFERSRNHSTELVVEPDLKPIEYLPMVVNKVRDMPSSGSWKEKRASGHIHMTEGSIVNETTYNYVAELRKHVSKPFIHWHYEAWECPSKNRSSDDFDAELRTGILSGEYVERADLSQVRELYKFVPYYPIMDDETHSKRLQANISEAWAELFTAYSLGEDLVEIRDMLEFAHSLIHSALKPLKAAKALREKFGDPGTSVKSTAEMWLQYRYALMPIIYSLQDIVNLLEDRSLFRTVRRTVSSKSVVNNDSKYRGDVGHNFLWENGMRTRVSRITLKSKYLSSSLKRFDLLDMNPLTTFTKTHRWSLVLNWFINIQEYVSAHIKARTTLADEIVGCVSERIKEDYSVYFRQYDDSRNSAEFVPRDWCNGMIDGYQRTLHWGTVIDDTHLLQRVVKDNYRRYFIKPSDVSLQVNTHLSTFRKVDALAIAYGRTSNKLNGLLR